MSLLREKMSESGFESNADYEFEVDCLLKGPCEGVRALNVQGEAGRHKTAFANALAHALEYKSILYFDFGHSQVEEDKEIEREIRQIGDNSDGKFIPPVKPLDKIISDACAYSESNTTFVVLDQLHLAQFRDHIRLYKFAQGGVWTYPNARFVANPKNMLLCLIAEEPLYHSLQKHSYRVWVHRHALRNLSFSAQELGFSDEANALIQGLSEMFTDLGVMPTVSEFKLLITDLLQFVRHEGQFAPAIYGRVSGIDYSSLYTQSMNTQFKILLPLLEDALHIEHINYGK